MIRLRDNWRQLAVTALLIVFAFGALCAVLSAQTVHVANYSGGTYDAWIRRTIDRLPEHPAGEIDGARYVVGRKIGLAGHVVDLRVKIAAGEARSFDLSKAAKWKFTPSTNLPTSTVRLAGVPLSAAPNAGGEPWVRQDGAGWLVHLAGRVTPMLYAHLWVTVYPDQPWAQGEIVLVASNPAIPDVTAHVPANLRLEIDGAVAIVPGQGFGAPLLREGDWLADGQARAWPVVICWLNRFTAADWSSAGAAYEVRIGAVGRQSIGPLGIAEAPPLFSAGAWTARELPGAIARLHSWDAGQLGVAANSRVSGDQEDQALVPPAEALQAGGVGAELVRYFVALGQARRPCHRLERDGSLLEPDWHPNLVLWDAIPLDSSRDRLGKTSRPPDMHGWAGPDTQHWWLVTLCSAAEVMGSPALQYLLEMQARLYLTQWTVKPGLFTSLPGEPRSIGQEGLFTVWLHRVLEDRSLALRVRERCVDRMVYVIVPACTKTTEVAAWAPSDDARILAEVGGGFRLGWHVWQQALGAFGLDVAGEHFGVPEARRCALAGALAVVQHGYTLRADGLWIEWDMIGHNPDGAALRADQYVEGRGAHRTGWFRHAWIPGATAVLLRHDPTHARARAINEQLLAEERRGNRPIEWVLPVPAVPAAASAVPVPAAGTDR